MEDIPDILPYSLFLIPYYLFLYIIIIFFFLHTFLLEPLPPPPTVLRGSTKSADRSLLSTHSALTDEVPNESTPSEYRGKGLEYQVERSTLVQSTLLPAAQQ